MSRTSRKAVPNLADRSAWWGRSGVSETEPVARTPDLWRSSLQERSPWMPAPHPPGSVLVTAGVDGRGIAQSAQSQIRRRDVDDPERPSGLGDA